MSKFGRSDDALARVFRNSAWLFSSKGVAAVFSFFYLAILTRALGPEGFGEIILITSAIHILFSILHFDTWQSVVHFGVPHLLAGDKRSFSLLAMATFLIEFAGSVLSLLVLIICLPLLADYFGWQEHIQQGALLYGVLVFFATRSSAIGILRAHDQFRDGALGDTVIPVARLIGALILLWIGPDLLGFVFVWGLSEVASAFTIWGFIVYRNGLSIRGITPSALANQIRSETGYFAFLLSTNFTYLFSNLRERLVVVIIGMTVSTPAAGLFRLADQLANSVNRLTEIFARPLFAELSRLYAARESLELHSLYTRSLKISALSGGVMFILLVAIGKPLIYAMSGEAFLAAYPMLLLLGAATIFGLIGLGLEPLLQAAGKAHLSVVIRVVGLLILGGLLAILLPGYGAMGASLAMLISAAIVLLLMLWFSWREVRSLR